MFSSCSVGQRMLRVLFSLVVLSFFVSSADMSSLPDSEFISSRRNRHATNERLVTAEVNPTELIMVEGSEVEVECKASWRGRRTPDDIADVHFNWWIARDTVLPLGSHLPGVVIRTVSDDYTDDDANSPLQRRSESVRTLTIGSSMYQVLPHGLSRFSCNALSPKHGHSEPAFFYIRKI